MTGNGTISSAAAPVTISGAVADGGNGFNLTKSGAATLTLLGANTYGATNITAGTLQIGNGGTSGTLGAGAVTNDGTLTFNRSDNYGGNVGNAIGGAGTVNLQQGNLTLTGTSTYTGLTNVNGGTLKVNGSLAATAVTVASGATLGGGGSLGGTVTAQSGSHLAPGNSVGNLTVAGLQLTGGTILDFEFNTVPANDRIIVSALDGLVINGGGFNLYQSGTTNAFTTNGTYNLLQYLGAIGGTGVSSLTVLNPSAAHTYTFGASGGFVTLTIADTNSNSYWAPQAGGGGNGTWSSSSMVWAASTGVQGSSAQGGGSLVFTDNAGTVTVSGTVSTANGLVVSTNGYTFAGGEIDLTGAVNSINVALGVSTQINSLLNVSNGLTKAGAGTLTVTVGSLPNVTVSGGVLSVGSSVTLSSGANVSVASSAAATLAGSATLGTVTADGAVNLNGLTVSIVTLNGALGGSLNVGAGTALTINGGTLNGNLTSADGTATLTKASSDTLNLNGNNTGFLGTTTISAGTLSVDTALGGTVIINGGSFIGAGAAGSHVQNNGGTQTVDGNQSGTTTVSGGTTDVGSGGTLSGPTNVGSGNLNVQSGGTVSGSLTQTGGTVTVESGGQTTGGIAVNGGSFTVQNGGSASSTGTGGISISGGAAFNLNGGAQITGNGVIHVGGTFIANGTMAPGSTTSVDNGGLLKSTGTTGFVEAHSGGTVSPGNSVGTMSTGGANLQLDGGTNLVFEFRNATGSLPGTDWDKIDLGPSGQLVINADNIDLSNRINLYVSSWSLDNSGPGAANGFNTTPGTVGNIQTYDWLFIAANSVNVMDLQPGSIEGRFNVIDNAANGVFDAGNPFTRPMSSMGQGTFSVVWSTTGFNSQGSGLYIHYSAIPEPGSMALCGLASLAAGWYGRRRLRRTENAAEAK